MKPEEVLKYCNDNGIKFIDLKFNDLPGLWQHFTITLNELRWLIHPRFPGNQRERHASHARCIDRHS